MMSKPKCRTCGQPFDQHKGVVALCEDVQLFEAMRDGFAVRASDYESKIRMLELKCRNSLANNLCPDHRDKQVGKPCLACTVETLERKNSRLSSDLAECRELLAGFWETFGFDEQRAQEAIDDGHPEMAETRKQVLKQSATAIRAAVEQYTKGER